jgi:hypothetical protein
MENGEFSSFGVVDAIPLDNDGSNSIVGDQVTEMSSLNDSGDNHLNAIHLLHHPLQNTAPPKFWTAPSVNAPPQKLLHPITLHPPVSQDDKHHELGSLGTRHSHSSSRSHHTTHTLQITHHNPFREPVTHTGPSRIMGLPSLMNHGPIPPPPAQGLQLNTNVQESIIKGLSRTQLEALQAEINNILRHYDTLEITTPPNDFISNNVSPFLKYISTIHFLQGENNRLKSQVSSPLNNGFSFPGFHALNNMTPPEKEKQPLSNLDRGSFSNGNHVNEKKEEEEKRPYKCTYDGCNKSFAKSSRLKRHSVTHNENRERFYCTKEDCNRSYGTKYDLVAHQKQKHSKDSKPYKCNFGSCEATFESKKMLDRHKLEHMKEGDYEFSHLVFSISGTLSKKRVEFVKLIHEHGAQFVSSVTHKVRKTKKTPQQIFIYLLVGDTLNKYTK